MKDIYVSKSKEYYSHVREDIISQIPQNPQQTVLEIGAGGGYTLQYIKEHGLAREVYGVELFDIPNSFQKSLDFHAFIIADIEQNFPESLPEEYFDVIICGDVLEHLVDPWVVVQRLSKLLKKGGKMIVSLPNIREFKTIMKIFVGGDFRYTPEGGIMDKTHLRFFCKKNAVELLTTNELHVVAYHPNFKLIKKARKKRMVNNLTLGFFQEFLAYQHLVIAQKK